MSAFTSVFSGLYLAAWRAQRTPSRIELAARRTPLELFSQQKVAYQTRGHERQMRGEAPSATARCQPHALGTCTLESTGAQG
jgi:hypothetical protein